MSNEDALEELNGVLSHFSSGMLVTLGADQTPQARPMHIAERDEDGTMWFVTSADSAKASELRRDPRASVTFQSGSRYAHIHGHILLSDSQEKIRALWSDAWRVWFPDGPTADDILLLRFSPRAGEYWDISGTQAISFVLDAAWAAFSGEEIPSRDARHDTVKLR